MIYLILLLGTFLRLINLNQSLWLDEAIEALALKNNSFIDLITKYSVADFHPVLYHFILKIWTSVFGFSEIALRLPSVIFGVLTIFFVYKIAEKKYANIAALFMAINPLAIYYSQEGRMYSLAMMAVTASWYFYQEKKWVWWGIFFLIGLYTDYLVWFMIPVYLLFNKKTLVISIFLLPALYLLKEQLVVGMQTANANPIWGQVVGGFDFKAVPLTLVKFIFGRITIDNKYLYAAVFGSVSLVYLWVLSEAKSKKVWLWLGLPILIAFIVSLKIPVYSYFRLLFVLPAFILLLAEGIKNKLQIIFIIFISVISFITFIYFPRFQREGWRDVAQYIGHNQKVFLPSVAQDAPLNYYDSSLKIEDKNNISIGQEKQVYLVRYVQEIFDQRDFLRKVIELSNYHKVEEKSFNGVVVWKYENRN